MMRYIRMVFDFACWLAPRVNGSREVFYVVIRKGNECEDALSAVRIFNERYIGYAKARFAAARSQPPVTVQELTVEERWASMQRAERD